MHILLFELILDHRLANEYLVMVSLTKIFQKHERKISAGFYMHHAVTLLILVYMELYEILKCSLLYYFSIPECNMRKKIQNKPYDEL